MKTKPIEIICLIEGGLPSFYVKKTNVSRINVTVLDRDNLEVGELDEKEFEEIEGRIEKMEEIGFHQPDFSYPSPDNLDDLEGNEK